MRDSLTWRTLIALVPWSLVVVHHFSEVQDWTGRFSSALRTINRCDGVVDESGDPEVRSWWWFKREGLGGGRGEL
jgi:hypothetical protein